MAGHFLILFNFEVFKPKKNNRFRRKIYGAKILFGAKPNANDLQLVLPLLWTITALFNSACLYGLYFKLGSPAYIFISTWLLAKLEFRLENRSGVREMGG